MTKCKVCSLFLVIVCAVFLSSTVSAQFVTLARKIKSKHSGQTHSASVIVDAKPHQVYQAIIDTLTTNTKFIINTINDAKRIVDFTTGTYVVSMKVDSLAAGQAEITATVPPSGTTPKTASDIAVRAVIAACQKLGVKYTVDNE